MIAMPSFRLNMNVVPMPLVLAGLTFFRVKDPLDVVQKPVIGLQEASLLDHFPSSAGGWLRFLFSVEKGGSSTKLVLQVLNCKTQHSTPTA